MDPADGRRAGLERALRAAVRSGRLAPGTRLPATRRLAAELGLARGTVRAAYDQLITEGYLTARQGSGTAVARLPAPVPVRGTGEAPDAPRHDLRPGSPDTSAFPAAAWLRSARRALGGAASEVYGYGDPRGRPELRAALAGYLGRARGVPARPESIVIVNGYVQGLGLLARVLGGGAAVAMEDPGAAFYREVVRRNGPSVVALPVDERGARTDLLGPDVDAAVVTPAHQYPTGETLDPGRRRALTGWARDTGGLVIESDYDGEFRYDRRPVGAVQGTAPDHVVYVGTASKTLGPALRLAWMVLPEPLVEPVAEAKRYDDHATETLGQLTLADLIESHGYDRHVRACRVRYRRRRDALLARLRGFGLPVHGIAAGLQVMVSLPAGGPDERDVREAADARGLALGYLGDRWQEPGDRHPQGLVVGYGRPPEHAYAAALDALSATLADALPAKV